MDDNGTWPDVCNEFLQRLLTGEVLGQSYVSVARAVKKYEEGEACLSDCIRKSARICRKLLTKRQVVNSYIQVLKTSVWDPIGAAKRIMSEADKRSLTVV